MAQAAPLQLLDKMNSLADETRLRLLHLLERHELGVVDLCDILQMPQSTVSRHLKVLSDQKWCNNRRQGTGNLYHMDLDELTLPARRLWLLTREQTSQWSTLHQDQLRLQRRLTQKTETSEAFFDSSANKWDKLRHELYGDFFGITAQLALLPATWTVADLGCGTGAITASLAAHVQQVMGVDQSAEMLKAAKLRTRDLANVTLQRGAMEAIPIDDQTCDAAMMVLVLTYLVDLQAAIGQAKRILKPGGKLVIVDLLRHDRDDFRRQLGQQCLGFGSNEMVELLKQAGLENVSFRPLPPAPEAKGPALFLATATRH